MQKVDVAVRLGISPVMWNLKIGALRTHMINYAFWISRILHWEAASIIFRKDDTNDSKWSNEIFNEIINIFTKYLHIQYNDALIIKQSDRRDLYSSYLHKLSTNDILISRDTSWAMAIDVRRYIDLFWSRISIKDLILGDISFDLKSTLIATDKDSFLITRNDWSYLYNFTSPIDDDLESITHVIRGGDKLWNVPYQEIVRRSLWLKEKQYVHLPMLLAHESDHATFPGLISMWISPRAIVAYMISSVYKDDNLWDIDEFYKAFDCKKINKKNALFDMKKLQFIHRQIVGNLSKEDFIDDFSSYIYSQHNWIENLLHSPLVNFLYEERKRSYAELYQIGKCLVQWENLMEYEAIDNDFCLIVRKWLWVLNKDNWVVIKSRIDLEAIRRILIGKRSWIDAMKLFQYMSAEWLICYKIKQAEDYILSHLS